MMAWPLRSPHKKSALTFPASLWNSIRPFMYVTIRRYRTNSPEHITRVVNESFVSQIKRIPGFVAYYGIDTQENLWASVSIFNSKEGAQQSDELARSLLQDDCLVEMLSAPEITAGQVVTL
jgi:hypothetical protein